MSDAPPTKRLKIEANPLVAFLVGDTEADRVVPKTGATAWLTVFTSAVMAFLAVFALALALSTQHLAQIWADELRKSATIRVSAPEGQVATRTAQVIQILETTPGIASARALSDEEQRALLEPWLGKTLALDALPVPQLIDIVAGDPPFDTETLRLRLAGEVPGAVLDDHARWRAPMIEAANRVRALGIAALGLIGGAMAAMITLAASAALSANGQVIEVLRLIGARDVYIARAFVRRFTLRALGGAIIGASVATSVIAVLPPATETAGFLTGLGFRGLEWLWAGVIPLVAGIVAFWATRATAMHRLKAMA